MKIKQSIIIILLGALALEAQVNLTQKQETYMAKEYHATPCTDAKLVQEFHALQDKLHIIPHAQLFETDKAPSSLPPNTIAFYTSGVKCVAIVKNKFYKYPKLYQTQVLYHELRHHMQATTAAAQQSVAAYSSAQWLSKQQAKEFDADIFGIQQATNNCPKCMKELKHYFEATKPVLFKYHGYATQQDFKPLIKAAEENPNFCQKHATI